MAEPLKNIYNDIFFAELKTSLQHAVPSIDTTSFIKTVRNEAWHSMELKQRMRQLSAVLYDHLEGDYEHRLGSLLKLVDALPKNTKVQYSGLAYMYIPDFLAQHGMRNVKASLQAMEKINMLTSCEFAIRPFLLADEKKIMKQMLIWSTHSHENIRRFASEGCRPRLPWGAAIPAFKKDPSPIIPILENLKSDPSVYVQKSVANNLNDISKDHPELVLDIASRWQGKSSITDWIIKHACRGLLKSGHTATLNLFGTRSDILCNLKTFKIDDKNVKISSEFEFQFSIILEEAQPQKLRLEYAIYYRKANGSLSKKVFKIAEGLYDNRKQHSFKKKHSFRDLTTRKHYPGKHFLAIIINGSEIKKREFMLGL